MAVELKVPILRRTGGKRGIQWRIDPKERDTTQLKLTEITFNLTSQSRTRKAQIGVENELIWNIFSLIHHLESQIAPLKEEITQLTQWSKYLWRVLEWMCLYKHKTSIIYRRNEQYHCNSGYFLEPSSETQIMTDGIINRFINRKLENFLVVSMFGFVLLCPRQMYTLRKVRGKKDSLWYLWIKLRLISSKPCLGQPCIQGQLPQ